MGRRATGWRRALTGAGGGGGAPDPDAAILALFAARKGFAVKLDDKESLFQNTNGTGAVTSDSDPIGYATDISGNGNHPTASGSARPLYVAGKAVFDGVNSTLATPAIDLSTVSKVTVVMTVKRTGTGNHGLLSNGASSAGTFNIGWFSGNAAWRAQMYGSSSSVYSTMPDSPAFGRHVLSFVLDLAETTLSDSILLRDQGEPTDGYEAGTVPCGGNLANAAIFIGYWNYFLFSGDVYRVALFEGELSAEEMLVAEQWAAIPIGVSILPQVPPAGASDITHFMSYGQSLSVGTQSRPAISTTPNGHYTFDGVGHVRAWDSTDPYTAFQAHLENDSAVELMGETPCYGAYQIIDQLGGYSKQFLASAPGYGALTISDLSTGSGYYTRLLTDVTNGRKLSRAQGKQFKCRAVMWMQGESDGTNNTYAADMNALRGTLDTDIKSITHQADDVWMLSYQLARAKIGLAHLAASDTYAAIRVAMPMYFLPTTDTVHLTAASSKIAGAYFGLAYKRIIVDGDTAWKPLQCTGASVVGTTIDLTYNKSGLTFDATIVASQTNHGFRVINAADAALTISSVAIIGSVVRIVVASGTPAKVYYGFSDPAGDIVEAGGNLRDSQGDAIVFDGGGLDYPMHNWAVLQSVTLP